jgi:hypothetical protein
MISLRASALGLAVLGAVGCDRAPGTSSPTPTSTSGSGAGAHGAAGGGSDFCPDCGEPVGKGSLANGAIDEASGLAASRIHAGVYYLHNDSGDRARMFATDSTGADLGTFTIAGATAVDWEDMAVGPCPQGSCVYLADVGDNKAVRTSYAIHRAAEPATVGPGAHDLVGETFPFVYPDGSHNSETLLVHPASGQLWLVTKVSDGASGVYRFPLPLAPGKPAVLEKLGELAPPSGSKSYTGGDVHPKGKGVLLRTYSHVWFLAAAGGEQSWLSAAACSVPAPLEPQGEAIAWSAAGDGFVTVSEGSASTLYQVSCGP